MRVLDVKGNTEAENESPGKWKGHIIASVAVPLDRSWQIGSDFSGLHKFVPIVEVCERLKGRNRTPGCLRFYTMNTATGLPGGKRKAWAKDRLLNIDEETHSYTYAVEGSNMHLENCQISFKASDGKDGTTIVKWAWEVDPIKKCTKEKTLSDMSEFGCTFIKGLEAAAATADSINFDFEGAPPDSLSCDDDGGGRPDRPILSLMKSRLETLTQSLNKISQKLENGPIPPDLYHNELESLQSILAEGQRSLVCHMHGYLSDARVCESKSVGTTSMTAERYEDYILSTTEKISSPADASTSKTDSEACQRKCLDAITRLRLPDNGKAHRTLDGGKCQASSPAMFLPLASKEEQLRVEMDKASRGAYEAFQDFSHQFHIDLRDDISHQLGSVGTRLKSISAGLKDGAFKNRPKGESYRENYGRCGSMGHESALTAEQGSFPDARSSQSPPSDGAKMSCLGCQTPQYNHGQFGDQEPDKLQSRRLQESPKGRDSLRSRSGLLFQDLLQEDMFQDSDQAARLEAKDPPRTFESTNSFRDLNVTIGCAPCCLTQELGGQRSPPSNIPKVTNVPQEYHLSQQLGSESGRFRSSPPLQDDNTHIQGGLNAKDQQHINDLESGGHDQGLTMDHQTSELRRRTLGPEGHKASLTGLLPDDSSSQEFQSSEESREGFQQLQDSPQGWQHRGSKMSRTSQNLEADVSRLQNTENKLQEASPDESKDGEFQEYNALRRPSRLPLDIWPAFPHAESGRDGDLVKEGQGEDSTRREFTGNNLENFECRREEFQLGTTQNTRAIVGDSASPSPSSSSSQSSKSYKKLLQLKSRPLRFSLSGELVPQTVAGGLRSHVTSPIPSLDEISSKNSPLTGSPSGPLDQESDCPLSALHSFGQCAQHVLLDLGNEIAPGVFHSRQGKQARVIIDIPEDLEARQASRRHLRSLLRKAEIYKEFALLGIQKPPTEEQLLADFASARYKKQQPISEAETPTNVSPVYKPYYSDGRVFLPEAGPLPTNVGKSLFEHADAYTVDLPSSTHPTNAKSPSGQNAGHLSETRILSSNSGDSRRGSPSGQIMERKPQAEQQFNVTNCFQKDESHITSENLRGETTAQELASAEYFNRTKPPRGGFHGYPGSQPRVQSPEGFRCRHGFPLQQKREIPIKGHGRRRDTPHVRQPFISNGQAKTNSGVSSLTESPPLQPCSSEGKRKTKSGVSSWTESSPHISKTGYGDKACREHTSVGSGDLFIHREIPDEISSDFPTSPEIYPENRPEISSEIRMYSHAKNLLKIHTPAIAIHTRNSRQSEGTPRSSGEGSIAKILLNFPRDSGDTEQLELTHYRPPTSRQGSLDKVVNNVPSDSGSSEFDPFRPCGRLRSVNGSSGSDTSNGFPFSRQLHIADVHRNTTPTTEKPPSPTDSLTLLHFDEPEKLRNTIDSLMSPDDPLAEGQRIINALKSSGRCHDCPFKPLKREVDEIVQTSESGTPRSYSPGFSVRVLWADRHSRPSPVSSRSEGEESAGPIQETRSHCLDEVSRQLDSKLLKTYLDAETQTGSEAEGEGLRTRQDTQTGMEAEGEGLRTSQDTQIGMEAEGEGLRTSQDTQNGKAPEAEGLKARRYSQILDSMASRAAQFPDDPKAQTQKLDDMVHETEDVGLISSWNAKKKRKADELAVRTRSTITMLNSAINVREFTDDSRLYSIWLDGVATQTPEGNERRSQNSETQTLGDASEKSESSKEPRGEPRFCEDSAANFLDSVAGQILHEFSDSQKTDADAQDQSEGPQEPRFREDSAANFLGAMSQKIVQEFTDNTPNQSQTLDQSEGPKERRFREQSALEFLESLSEQLLPEFKNRGGSLTTETSQAGGAPRFRESSAINFLDALRGLVMQTSNQNSVSITEVLSSSEPSVLSEAGPRNQTYPTEDGTSQPYLDGQAYPIVGLSYQPELESHGSPADGMTFQPESEDQGSPYGALSYRPGSEDRGSPDGDLSYQPESEGQGSPGGALSHQPESEGRRSTDWGLTYQPESEGQGSRDGGLRYQPESGQEFSDGALSYQPESEGRRSTDWGLTYQPESEGQGSPDGGLRYQPESGQEFSDGALSYQPESEDQGSLHGALSYRPGSENQGFPDGGLSYQPESESQGSPGGALSHQPESEGQDFPDVALSYQPESEGRGSADWGLTYQPESEGQGPPDGGLRYQLKSGQELLDGALSYQPESENQGSTGGALSNQPESEGQGSPDGDLSYQPESEGQGYPDEDLSYQPDAENEAYLAESVGSQPDGSTSTKADQEFQNQLLHGNRRNSQAQLRALGPRGSRRSSQVAVLNEMLQDLHATVLRSRQNSVSNPGGS